ncbi:hypothetical protein ACIPW5_22360 [Streptomyces sp. NPDC090077]|uniref:hypothetical protein n=1 Tax=Streptomyces sp. NPDC090077 TaxID=3365938 RepID=UPI003804B6A2
MRVEVHIERLVVDGAELGERLPGPGHRLPAHREEAFRAALVGELSALFAAPGAELPRAPRAAGPVVVALAPPEGSAGAAATGRAVARSVYAALVPGGGRGRA